MKPKLAPCVFADFRGGASFDLRAAAVLPTTWNWRPADQTLHSWEVGCPIVSTANSLSPAGTTQLFCRCSPPPTPLHQSYIKKRQVLLWFSTAFVDFVCSGRRYCYGDFPSPLKRALKRARRVKTTRHKLHQRTRSKLTNISATRPEPGVSQQTFIGFAQHLSQGDRGQRLRVQIPHDVVDEILL